MGRDEESPNESGRFAEAVPLYRSVLASAPSTIAEVIPARAAAVTPGADAAKETAALSAVNSALDAQGQSCASGGCTVTFEECDGARCARVKVLIDYDALIPGFGLVLPDQLTYTAVARVS